MWQGFSSSWEVRLKATGGAGEAGKVQRGSGKRIEQQSVASRVHSAPSSLGSSTVCSRHLLTTILAVRDVKGNEIQSSVTRALGISVLRWKGDWGYDTYMPAVGDLRLRSIKPGYVGPFTLHVLYCSVKPRKEVFFLQRPVLVLDLWFKTRQQSDKTSSSHSCPLSLH